MHIALANFYLMSVTGPPRSSEIKSIQVEKTVTAKPDVIALLKRSLAAVKNARGYQTERSSTAVKVEGRDTTVDGIYLRIYPHDNEHMGHLVTYARMNGIVPTWSERTAK